MKASFSLGKLFGIRVQVHWTFLLIILWAVYMGLSRGGTTESILWTVALVLSIFVCVVLHELGHSLTARRYGIATSKITLLPIGGVASLERMPENPKQELMVAVMGPAVNVFIAGLLYLFVSSQLEIFQQPEEAASFFQEINAGNFLLNLFIVNIMLVLFNAIPAFPMDGGRVLRALLSFRMDRVKATQIAANLGQVIAVLFFFIGLYYNPILLIIGVFVFFGASGEYTMVQQMSVLRGHKVREAMLSNYTILHPEDSLKRVGEVLLSGMERHFVVAHNANEVVGILPQSKIAAAFRDQHHNLTVANIMDQNFKVLSPQDDLTEVYRLVQGGRYPFFPVMENGNLIGAVDMENINEFIMIQARLNY